MFTPCAAVMFVGIIVLMPLKLFGINFESCTAALDFNTGCALTQTCKLIGLCCWLTLVVCLGPRPDLTAEPGLVSQSSQYITDTTPLDASLSVIAGLKNTCGCQDESKSNPFNFMPRPSLKNTVPGAYCIRVCSPSVSECVSLCVPKTL